LPDFAGSLKYMRAETQRQLGDGVSPIGFDRSQQRAERHGVSNRGMVLCDGRHKRTGERLCRIG